MYSHQLDTFIRVADLGSFGKAAVALFISAPAVIQQINLLEEECGIRLFVRTNHGVKLTPSGQSLYQDAKTIIRLSDDAVVRAKLLAETSEHTIRIGTSLLFKCRLLPDIWTKINEQYSDLKIEILPLPESSANDEGDSVLGIKYDIREGIYCSAVEKETCSFLELMRTPFCCAVSKNHRLAKCKKLSLKDLNGEYLVMPIEHISDELDTFRKQIMDQYPTVHIIDSPYYGVNTFTLCEVNPYILITQAVYADIHTRLVTIPLEIPLTMPYGIIYARTPNPATKKFIAAVQKISGF